MPALLHHLRDLDRLDHATIADAKQFAGEVLQVATDDNITYSSQALLCGPTVEGGSIVHKNVTIRTLTGIERGDAMDSFRSAFIPGLHDIPNAVLEVRSDIPRDEFPPFHDTTLFNVVDAAQLHGYQLAIVSAQKQAALKWVWDTRFILRPLSTPHKMPEQMPITSSNFQSVIMTSEALNAYALDSPRNPRDLALHRFRIGASRESKIDALLDFTIALEALLLPYDKGARRGDLSYRFRVHGAHYLARCASERSDVAKWLGEIYEMRSRLVHGGKYPEYKAIETVYDHALDLVRRGLMRAVHDKFPTAEDFNRMVLQV